MFDLRAQVLRQMKLRRLGEPPCLPEQQLQADGSCVTVCTAPDVYDRTKDTCFCPDGQDRKETDGLCFDAPCVDSPDPNMDSFCECHAGFRLVDGRCEPDAGSARLAGAFGALGVGAMLGGFYGRSVKGAAIGGAVGLLFGLGAFGDIK